MELNDYEYVKNWYISNHDEFKKKSNDLAFLREVNVNDRSEAWYHTYNELIEYIDKLNVITVRLDSVLWYKFCVDAHSLINA